MSQDASSSFDQYPAARLDFLKSKKKWYVIVSIPAHLKQLFSNQVDVRRSTGTSDKATAQRKLHSLTQQIYAVFDQRQNAAKKAGHDRVDAYAVRAIMDAAKAFNYNRGNIPKLEPQTDYLELENLKKRLDGYVQYVQDDEVNLNERLNAVGDVSREANQAGVDVSVKIKAKDPLTDFANLRLPEETPENTEWLNKMRLARAKGDDVVSGEKLIALTAYDTTLVSSYWQDLLTLAAQEQGLPLPAFDEIKGAAMVDVNGTLYPEKAVRLIGNWMAPVGSTFNNQFQPVDRPRRTQLPAARTLSSVMDEYVARVRRDYDVVDTQKKLIRWANQFVDYMGDLEVAEIKPKHAYDYCDLVLERKPNLKNKTIKDYCWGVFALLTHCVKKDYIQANPFRDLDLSKYGKSSDEWQPYTQSELRKIFLHEWSEQDRLLLSLVATTGMRPSEAGNLTWERFNDTEQEGIRYFTLKDTPFERVRVKNRGSARDVPLHPDLKLPKRATGRLFDYKQDEDGRCGTEIGHQLNPVLQRLVPHPYKSMRSFRQTFKKIMRAAKVSEEVHDFMTGHRQGDSASRKNYGGMDIEVMFEALSTCDFSFLSGE